MTMKRKCKEGRSSSAVHFIVIFSIDREVMRQLHVANFQSGEWWLLTVGLEISQRETHSEPLFFGPSKTGIKASTERELPQRRQRG
jgi:hypothetical protein